MMEVLKEVMSRLPTLLIIVGMIFALIGIVGSVSTPSFSFAVTSAFERALSITIGVVLMAIGVAVEIRKPISMPRLKGKPRQSEGCIQIVTRDEVDKTVGTVHERLRKARYSVWISGNDNKYIVESAFPWIEDALRREVFVKILSVDPLSSVPEMLAKIDPRFPTPEAFRASMLSVDQILWYLRKNYPHHFEFRYLPILPAMGFFIVDATSPTGLVKVEIYTAKPFVPLGSRPHLLLSDSEVKWKEFFITQWENYWRLAREPKEPLSSEQFFA